MHNARNVANQFIEWGVERGRPFTPLQIQKLTYLAHAHMLAVYDCPLIEGHYQAWMYGPVLPDIYYALSHHGRSPVTETIPIHPDFANPSFSAEEIDIMRRTMGTFGNMSGNELIKLTHKWGSPWHRAKLAGRMFIPNSYMQDYYKLTIDVEAHRAAVKR